jgi:hypothetical protein
MTQEKSRRITTYCPPPVFSFDSVGDMALSFVASWIGLLLCLYGCTLIELMEASLMSMAYVHQKLDEDMQSISGTYTPLRELKLVYNSREALCVIGRAIVDTACCGSGNFMYATVPGFIVEWKGSFNEQGLSVSLVEPVRDEAARREMARSVKENEHIYNIDFW